ncbi:MAG: hypothetical protein ACK4NE_01475 [Albidovulum sp.]
MAGDFTPFARFQTLSSFTLAAGQGFDMGRQARLDLRSRLRAWILDGRVSVLLAWVGIAPGVDFVDAILVLR